MILAMSMFYDVIFFVLSSISMWSAKCHNAYNFALQKFITLLRNNIMLIITMCDTLRPLGIQFTLFTLNTINSVALAWHINP